MGVQTLILYGLRAHGFWVLQGHHLHPFSSVWSPPFQVRDYLLCSSCLWKMRAPHSFPSYRCMYGPTKTFKAKWGILCILQLVVSNLFWTSHILLKSLRWALSKKPPKKLILRRSKNRCPHGPYEVNLPQSSPKTRALFLEALLAKPGLPLLKHPLFKTLMSILRVGATLGIKPMRDETNKNKKPEETKLLHVYTPTVGLYTL